MLRSSGVKAKRKRQPPARPATDRASDRPADTSDGPLTRIVGDNLRRLRVRGGLSLAALAERSGVSRSMLGQVELAQSAPTINVLWKIAHALQVPFSALLAESARGRSRLLKAEETKRLASIDGSFVSRALFRDQGPRRAEFYELRLAAGGFEQASPHAPGTVENLVVSQGELVMEVGDERFQLALGDAIQFEADLPHGYRNPGAREAVLYLVMTYSDEVSG